MVRVIAGSARGTLLKVRKGEGTRPTSDKVKGALFNILGPAFAGTAFLDLFAGSGAIGIEALSRGASLAVFVEKGFPAVRVIETNLARTGFAAKSRVLALDVQRALKVLGREGAAFEHIFLDPPYGGDFIGPALQGIHENRLLAERGTIIVEHGTGSCSWTEGPFDLYKQRTYGDTALTFLRGRDCEEGEIRS